MLPAFEKAKEVLFDENTMQDEIIKTQEVLIKACLNLRLIPNKDLLNDLIKQAESLKQENYSKVSWNFRNCFNYINRFFYYNGILIKNDEELLID